ncbi:MAG TPA: hypothetical protein VEI02_15200 [Planctomycetota bacterium]|nr:hypothetical protein [Planctomycetota bacterium]
MTIKLTAFIRRLQQRDGHLYVRLDRAQLQSAQLLHGTRVVMEIGGRVLLRGVIRTSGASPWVGPTEITSNAVHHAALKGAGYVYGDNVEATVRRA